MVRHLKATDRILSVSAAGEDLRGVLDVLGDVTGVLYRSDAGGDR